MTSLCILFGMKKFNCLYAILFFFFYFIIVRLHLGLQLLFLLMNLQDEHLMNHLVKNNLFKPIIDVFVANGDRYNLLNSAVLDLFEYIRKVVYSFYFPFPMIVTTIFYCFSDSLFIMCLLQENLKVLLRYLVDTFWDQLSKFESLSSIHALKVKYEQVLSILLW